jgi:hypothetical protein
MKMMNDEIITEVRQVREAHAAKFGYDLHAIYEDFKKLEVEYAALGYKFVNIPNSAGERINPRRRTNALS